MVGSWILTFERQLRGDGIRVEPRLKMKKPGYAGLVHMQNIGAIGHRGQ